MKKVVLLIIIALVAALALGRWMAADSGDRRASCRERV